MGELLPVAAVLALGVVVFYVAQRGLELRREVPVLALAFVMRILAAFAQVVITRGYYGGGDAMSYHQGAVAIAGLVSDQPERFLPRVMDLVFHGEPHFPIYFYGAGTPTGTLYGLTALVALPTQGSIYAICIAYALFAFAASRALYQVFRERFPEHLRVPILLAVMAVPSVVFWTSGIVKEAAAMAGFGWMVFGLHRLAQRRWIQAALALGPGLVVAALVKGYVVAAFVVAAAVFLYWSRALGPGGSFRLRPHYIIGLGGLSILALVAFSRVFPQYSIQGVMEETVRLQEVGPLVEGGSNYQLASEDRSLIAQIVLSPLALLTALFRPLPYEASGITGAVNVLETTLITGWLLVVLYRRRWRDLLAIVRGSPLLVFCVTFIVLFGVGVGLASTNLGTLSRYRAPMMPLFVGLIAVLHGWRPLAARPPIPTGAAPTGRGS